MKAPNVGQFQRKGETRGRGNAPLVWSGPRSRLAAFYTNEDGEPTVGRHRYARCDVRRIVHEQALTFARRIAAPLAPADLDRMFFSETGSGPSCAEDARDRCGATSQTAAICPASRTPILGAIDVVEFHRIGDLDALRQRFISQSVFIRPFGDVLYLTPTLPLPWTNSPNRPRPSISCLAKGCLAEGVWVHGRRRHHHVWLERNAHLRYCQIDHLERW